MLTLLLIVLCFLLAPVVYVYFRITEKPFQKLFDFVRGVFERE